MVEIISKFQPTEKAYKPWGPEEAEAHDRKFPRMRCSNAACVEEISGPVGYGLVAQNGSECPHCKNREPHLQQGERGYLLRVPAEELYPNAFK